MAIINDFELTDNEKNTIENVVDQIAYKMMDCGKLTMEDIQKCTGLSRERMYELCFAAEESLVFEDENKSLDETLNDMRVLAEDMLSKVHRFEKMRESYMKNEGKTTYDEFRKRLRFEMWQAREQGKAEVRHQVARTMLAEQEPVEYIAKVTGLTEAEIESLEKLVE